MEYIKPCEHLLPVMHIIIEDTGYTESSLPDRELDWALNEVSSTALVKPSGIVPTTPN